MAERAVYQKSFDQVAMPKDTGETRATIGAISQVTNTFVNIAEKHEDMKLASLASQADNEMMVATESLQKKYALEPTSEKARKDTDDTYNKIFSKYDEQVGFMSKGQWAQKKELLKSVYAKQNIQWAGKQTETNAENYLNDTIKNTVDKSYALGASGNAQQAVESFAAQEAEIRKGLTGLLPEDKIQESLENFARDNVQSYIMGVSARDPEQAMQELKGKTAQKYLSAEQTVKLQDAIFTQQKKLTLKQKQAQFDAHAQFDEEAENLPYAKQLQTLEAGAKKGKYDHDWAESKKRALMSKNGVDAETIEQTMYDFIDKKSLIVSGRDKAKAEDYLLEVRNFEIEVNNKIASGELKQKDGMRLISSVRQSGETNFVVDKSSELKNGQFMTFNQGQAKKVFKNKDLSEKSMQNASIDFFYTTQDNPKMTEAQKKDLALSIAERYREIDRTKKIQNVSKGYFETEEDAINSKLPKGTIVIINGKRARIT